MLSFTMLHQVGFPRLGPFVYRRTALGLRDGRLPRTPDFGIGRVSSDVPGGVWGRYQFGEPRKAEQRGCGWVDIECGGGPPGHRRGVIGHRVSQMPDKCKAHRY